MLQCIMCDCITVLNLNAVVRPVLRLCHFHLKKREKEVLLFLHCEEFNVDE